MLDMKQVSSGGLKAGTTSKESRKESKSEDFNPDLLRFLKYMQFKQDCVWHQYTHPVRLDYDKAVGCRDLLLSQQEEKVILLGKVMPKVKKMKWQNKPKRTHKKDGSLSVAGTNWFKACKENGLNPASKAAKEADKLKVFSHWEDPNPNSPDQVKDWLFSLGWKPCTFKYVKEDDGSERKIPQVRKDGELVPSVEVLIEDNPELEHLAGLTVIQHRLGIFKGFIECAIDQDGKYYLRAEIGGLTNTLRFKHKKPLVNLPGVDKVWGEEIRSCLIADEGEIMCGADMVSLESTTKRHYIYPYDPEYAEEMSQPGFDEHLDLAVKDGGITKEDYEYYQQHGETTDKGRAIHKIRKAYKPVNYSAMYGVWAPKLARETGKSVAESGRLLTAYWERNWAVKKVAAAQYVKEVGGYTWLKNPVSGIYHELRYDKDRFSTLNQSTGVYIFDSWLARCRLYGYMGQMQFHDETGASVADKTRTQRIMEAAVEKLNDDLTLNVIIGIDVKFGISYSDVH
jgi:hypothetical protein